MEQVVELVDDARSRIEGEVPLLMINFFVMQISFVSSTAGRKSPESFVIENSY